MPAKRANGKIAKCHKYPRTVQELAAMTGYSVPTIKVYIRELRADRRCYIFKWIVSGVNQVPVYARGRKEDAVKPPKPSKAQLADARMRERIREELARPAFRDPFIAALFGPYEARA